MPYYFKAYPNYGDKYNRKLALDIGKRKSLRIDHHKYTRRNGMTRHIKATDHERGEDMSKEEHNYSTLQKEKYEILANSQITQLLDIIIKGRVERLP